MGEQDLNALAVMAGDRENNDDAVLDRVKGLKARHPQDMDFFLHLHAIIEEHRPQLLPLI